MKNSVKGCILGTEILTLRILLDFENMGKMSTDKQKVNAYKKLHNLQNMTSRFSADPETLL